MQPAARPVRSRWLRLAIGAPAAVLGGVILSFAIGTSSASADEAPEPGLLSSVVGGAETLVKDVVKDTTSTVTQVTHSTTNVVKSVVKPAKDKPIKHIVETVVKVIPETTTSVTDTVENVVDNTTDLLDDTTDAVLPEAPAVVIPGVDTATSTPASQAVTATVEPTTGFTTTVAAPTTSVALTPTEDVSVAATAKSTPLTPEPLTFSPEPSAYAGSTGGVSPVAATTSGASFAPAIAALRATPENDVLPSTPTFDTDTSPD